MSARGLPGHVGRLATEGSQPADEVHALYKGCKESQAHARHCERSEAIQCLQCIGNAKVLHGVRGALELKGSGTFVTRLRVDNRHAVTGLLHSVRNDGRVVRGIDQARNDDGLGHRRTETTETRQGYMP